MLQAETPRLVLASASTARRAMLVAAGLTFDVAPADVDEKALRDAFLQSAGDADGSDLAEVLARAKAEAVSMQHPDDLVIGADQVLLLEGTHLHKPFDAKGAAEQLLALRGRTHTLHSAVALATAGASTWAATETAELAMRSFSDTFLQAYVAAAGEAIFGSVGAYQIESLGVHLFDRIDGDHFTILGLPLLALLDELRTRKVILA